MNYDDHEFVNRTDEVNLFASLLNQASQRILLLFGEEDMGKSWVIHRLRYLYKDSSIRAEVVDLRERCFNDAADVIEYLRARFDGSFDAPFAEAMPVDPSDLVPTIWQTGLSTRVVSAAPTLVGAASNEVSISGEHIHIGGSIAGGHIVTFNNSNVILNNPTILVVPDYATLRNQRDSERRRNHTFCKALAALVAEQRVVLFFDHYEDATPAIQEWLDSQLLSRHLDDMTAWPNLWLVFTGRVVPLLHTVHPMPRAVAELRLGPFSQETALEYLVKKRELTDVDMDYFMRSTRGRPGMLAAIASLWRGEE